VSIVKKRRDVEGAEVWWAWSCRPMVVRRVVNMNMARIRWMMAKKRGLELKMEKDGIKC